MAQTDRILVGVITGAHGIKGQVRIRSLTNEPEALAKYKPLTDATGAQVFTLKITGASNGALIASLKGVSDRNAAEALQGTELYTPRLALPKLKASEYYLADLLGLRVMDSAGNALGSVSDLQNFGAGDLLEIMPPEGKPFLLPFRDAFVPVVDLAKGLVVVDVPEGWRESTINKKSN